MKKKIGVKKQLSASVIAERSLKALERQKRAVPQKPKPVKHIQLKQILVSPEVRTQKGYREYGGFKIPDIPEGDKKFASEFVKLNRSKISRAEVKYHEETSKFARAIGGIKVEVRKNYKNLPQFVRQQLENYKDIKEAIQEFFASAEEKQLLRFYELIKKDEAFIQELSLRANEKIDVKKFEYIGDEIYVYTTSKNKKIKVRINWSPIHMEIIG